VRPLKALVVGNNPGAVRMYKVVTPPSIFFKSITFQRLLCMQGMHSRGVWNASLCILAGTQGQQILEPETKAQAGLQVIEQGFTENYSCSNQYYILKVFRYQTQDIWHSTQIK